MHKRLCQESTDRVQSPVQLRRETRKFNGDDSSHTEKTMHAVDSGGTEIYVGKIACMDLKIVHIANP